MQTYLKTKPVGIQLLLFLGMAFGIYMVINLLGAILYASIAGIDLSVLSNPKAWDYNDGRIKNLLRFLQTLQFFGLFVIPVFLFAYFSDPNPKRYLGLSAPSKNRYWIIGIAVMLVAIPMVQYTGLLNERLTGFFDPATQKWIKEMEAEANKIIKILLSERTPTELVLNIIFIALTAGIGEELFFRGILQRLFIRAFKNPWAGIIFTAFIFSAFHLQFLGFIPRFLLGIVLGAIYWYSGSLWPAIVAHFFYDAFWITVAYFNPQVIDNDTAIINEAQLAIWAAVSAVLTILLVWMMKKASTTSFAKVYEDDFKPKDEFSF